MSDIEARKKLVWEIDKQLQEDGARPVIQHGQGGTCWRPETKGIKLSRQLDLQSLALRGRLARSLTWR